MAGINTKIAPATWQVTTATIHCEMVHDYVTLIVHKDWSYKCTWCFKYKTVTGEHSRRKILKDKKDGIAKCQGLDCPNVLNYLSKLLNEEPEAGKTGILSH
jgi:hypothetical protein